jgi:hypothetical protein
MRASDHTGDQRHSAPQAASAPAPVLHALRRRRRGRRRISYFALLVAALAVMALWTAIGRTGRSADAPAVIGHAEPISWLVWGRGGASTTHQGFSVVFTFTAGGTVVSGSEPRFEADSVAGAHVCFRPGDPSDHELRTAAAQCGDPVSASR